MADITKQIYEVKYKYFDGFIWRENTERVISRDRDEAVRFIKDDPHCPTQKKGDVQILNCFPYRIKPLNLKV